MKILSYENFSKIKGSFWDSEIPKDAVLGIEAKNFAEKNNLKINGELINECFYIFRFNRSGNALIPFRVSMHPKTYENLKKGSKTYGMKHILDEL